MSLKYKYLASGLKVINAIILNKLTGKRVPLLSYILVTNACDLDCIYCFSEFHKSSSQHTPKGKIFEMIDQLEKNGTVLVTLTGGEPTLRNDLGEIVEYAANTRMMVELVSNGLNIKKHISSLRSLDFLGISIDGGEKDHDKVRGKGSFKTSIAALELGLENNIHCRIHCTLTRDNENSLPDVMRIAQKYNVKLNTSIPSVHLDDPSLAFDNKKIRSYYSQLKEFHSKGYPVSNAPSTLEYLSNWPGEFTYVSNKRDPNLPYLPCKRKDFGIYFDVNGESYPCANVWSEYKFNAFENGVMEAFDEFSKVSCNNCVFEAEFHHLFQGNLSSVSSMIALGFLDKIKQKFQNSTKN